MTNDNRSPAEIEREIEEQRSDLTSNLEDLQDKFSIDTLVRQVGDQFREHGGDMGRSISQQVKANPIPLALTGIGIAWMMFGNAQKSSSTVYDRDERFSAMEDEFRRSRAARGLPYKPPHTHPNQQTHDTPSWSRDYDDDDDSTMTERLSDGVADAKSEMSDAGASAKSTVSDSAQAAQDRMAAAKARLAEGTETLTEEGRARVIAARQKAVELRRQTSRSVSNGADAASDFYDRQPLVVGALALAVGAAIGGAAPRTETEDNLMGAQSDELFKEAERVFEEEKSKAMNVAAAVKDEAKDIAAETKADLDSGAPDDETAVEAVGHKAKATADRLSDAAKSAVKDEKHKS